MLQRFKMKFYDGSSRIKLSWADAALLFVAIVWGASYPVAKHTLDYTPVLLLIFYRFLISTLLIGGIYWKDVRSAPVASILNGIFLGVILCSIFLAETYGVAITSATNTALIISLCVLFTPFLEYGLIGRLPPTAILIGALLCCAGVGVLTGGLTSLGLGDLLVLGAAMLRAVMIVFTKRLMQRSPLSVGALTSIQSCTVTILIFIVILATSNSPDVLSNFLTTDAGFIFWAGVAFLSIFCTVAAFFIQNAAVQRSSPSRVSFLMGTEPFFGFLLAYLLLSEPANINSVMGAALIISGTFIGINSNSGEEK